MKIRKLILFSVIVSSLIFQSCEEVQNLLKPLSEDEVIEGLKEALKIGTDSTVKKVSKVDGYFKDAVIKILLPEEADIINEFRKTAIGEQMIGKMIDDLVLNINRTAEEAAKEVTPIFVNAITGMTINDGFAILKGENNAATTYLENNTRSGLMELYQPKIQNLLDKELVAGVSTNQAWNTLTSTWNNFVGSIAGQLAGYSNNDKINTNLDTYLTGKALDGVFIKLADEEEKIRTDPVAQVTDLLKRVFGENSGN